MIKYKFYKTLTTKFQFFIELLDLVMHELEN